MFFFNLMYVLRMGCFPVSLTSFSHSATHFCAAVILRLCFNGQIWALSLDTVCDSQTSINPIDLIEIATFVHHVWWPVWDNLSNTAYTDLTGFVTGTLIIFSQYPRTNCSCRVSIGYRPVSPYTARLQVWVFTPSACFLYFVLRLQREICVSHYTTPRGHNWLLAVFVCRIFSFLYHTSYKDRQLHKQGFAKKIWHVMLYHIYLGRVFRIYIWFGLSR